MFYKGTRLDFQRAHSIRVLKPGCLLLSLKLTWSFKLRMCSEAKACCINRSDFSADLNPKIINTLTVS